MGSEVDGYLHPSRVVQNQNEGEASNQSWAKDDVRKGSRGKGEAGKNRRQGFRRLGPEAEHLKSRPMNFTRPSRRGAARGVGRSVTEPSVACRSHMYILPLRVPPKVRQYEMQVASSSSIC